MTLDELKKICSEAAPGPWLNSSQDQSGFGTYYGVSYADNSTVVECCEWHHPSNMEFIAAFNPELVAKLLAVVEAARSVLSEEGVKEYLSAYVMGAELINRLETLTKETRIGGG